MPDPSALAPLFAEDVDTIHRRLLADVNAGREPNDPDWVDTTPGGWLSEQLRVAALEFERLWDAISQELPAAGMVAYAWGPFLDAHAEGYGLERKPASFASVVAQFTGEQDVVVGVGVEVAVPADPDADPDAEPILFRTTESGTIGESGVLELPAVATETGPASNVGPDAIELLYSTVTGTITSVTNPQAAGGGADPETDEQLRVRLLEHLQAPEGSGTAADLRRMALEEPSVIDATVEHLFAGDGTARIVLVGAGNLPVGPAVVDAVQQRIDPSSVIATVTADTALTNDPAGITLPVDDTTGFDPSGKVVAGQHLLRYTGKTDTTLTGVSGGEGTTLVDGATVRQSGRGAGEAPVGLTVVVATAETVTVDIAATIVPEAGYSVGGEAGTVNLNPRAEAAIRGYVDALRSGDDPILGRVEAAAFSVRGVYDVTACTIEGQAENFTIGPLQIAKCGTVTLT